MSLLMIGGIHIFLPLAQEGAQVCVAEGAATAKEQSAETVKEELEQVFEKNMSILRIVSMHSARN